MKNRGFTLIEILVVISIIGVLSSVILTSVNKARLSAQNTAINTQVKQYINVLKIIYLEDGQFPISEGHSAVSLGAPGSNSDAQLYSISDENLDNKLKQYIPSFPKASPLGAGYGSSDGKTASITWAVYQNGIGPSIIENDGGDLVESFGVEGACNNYEGATFLNYKIALCWTTLAGINEN